MTASIIQFPMKIDKKNEESPAIKQMRYSKLMTHHNGVVHPTTDGSGDLMVHITEQDLYALIEDIKLRVRAQTIWDLNAAKFGEDDTRNVLGERPPI